MMNTELQSCFDRLDSALNALIDSLASYNPSPANAAALLAADDELTSSLDQLYLHQRNHRKIKSLRLSVHTLDNRVKSALIQLVDMRKSLLGIESTLISAASREIDQRVLLDYAQRISHFTVPPTYQSSLPPSIPPEGTVDDLPVSSSGAETQVVNGTTRPSSILHEANTPLHSSTQPSHLSKVEGKALEALPTAVKAWLEPPSLNMPFMPWPDEERIRQGGLGQIESTWNRGLDPRGQDLSEIEQSGEAKTAEQIDQDGV